MYKSILAINKDGSIACCLSDNAIDCEHICHQSKGESPNEFINRSKQFISNTTDIESNIAKYKGYMTYPYILNGDKDKIDLFESICSLNKSIMFMNSRFVLMKDKLSKIIDDIAIKMSISEHIYANEIYRALSFMKSDTLSYEKRILILDESGINYNKDSVLKLYEREHNSVKSILSNININNGIFDKDFYIDNKIFISKNIRPAIKSPLIESKINIKSNIGMIEINDIKANIEIVSRNLLRFARSSVTNRYSMAFGIMTDINGFLDPDTLTWKGNAKGINIEINLTYKDLVDIFVKEDFPDPAIMYRNLSNNKIIV